MQADRTPTHFDYSGSSYTYNSSGNVNKAAPGLYMKKSTQIRSPTKMVLVSDVPFAAYFMFPSNNKPLLLAYWHNKQLGWGNVVFTDGHVGYYQAAMDKPDFQHGNDWTFVYSD